MRHNIAFPRVWPARSVGNRTLPVTLQPHGPDASPTPLPIAGGYATSVPGSRRVIDSEGVNPGRSFLGRDDVLDGGPAPDRINRQTPASNAGFIGRNMLWPYDGNALLVAHTDIPRRPITVTPFARTIDTGVTVPAILIGDPVG